MESCLLTKCRGRSPLVDRRPRNSWPAAAPSAASRSAAGRVAVRRGMATDSIGQGPPLDATRPPTDSTRCRAFSIRHPAPDTAHRSHRTRPVAASTRASAPRRQPCASRASHAEHWRDSAIRPPPAGASLHHPRAPRRHRAGDHSARRIETRGGGLRPARRPAGSRSSASVWSTENARDRPTRRCRSTATRSRVRRTSCRRACWSWPPGTV